VITITYSVTMTTSSRAEMLRDVIMYLSSKLSPASYDCLSENGKLTLCFDETDIVHGSIQTIGSVGYDWMIRNELHGIIVTAPSDHELLLMLKYQK